MSFECCILCKSPKRYPGCHDRCPDYAQARAKYDKAMADQKKAVRQSINAQKIAGVTRALRRRKGGK